MSPIRKCVDGICRHTPGSPSNGSPFTVTYLIDSNQDRTSNNPTPSTAICFLQAAEWRTPDGLRTSLGRALLVDVGGDDVGQRT